MHYDAEGIQIVSAEDPAKPMCNVHHFSFPPPFNLYVLPDDAAFVLKERHAAITLDDLQTRVIRRAEERAQQVIVYTVDAPVEEEEDEELCDGDEEESEGDDGDVSVNEDEDGLAIEDDAPVAADGRD